MIAAAVQFRAPKGQPSATREALAGWLERAAAEGAGLVVFPELATTGYIWRSVEEIQPHAEAADGPTFRVLSWIAAERGLWVVCGYPERAEDGALYNAAMVIGPRGQLITSYRKVLLYSADMPWARAGEQRVLLQSDFGTLMPAICMDINDNGLIRTLHQHRPDILAFPTSWVAEGSDVVAYWRARLSRFGGCFVAADNWGEDSGTVFAGQSCVLGPDGRILASLGPVGDGLALAELPKLKVQASFARA